MTASEFKSIRLKLGLSQTSLAEGLNMTTRNIIYYEKEDRQVPGTVACIMRLLSQDRIKLEEIKELCN